MTYKTVLVHCNDKSRMERVLGPAVEVAAQFNAHLIGLSIVPPVLVIPTGMPGTPDTVVVDEHCRAYRRDVPDMKAAFEAACRGRSLVAEWLDIDAGSRSVADTALEHARAVDLIVASQAEPKWPGTAHLDIADRLAVGSGRPVLVIPNAGEPRSVFGKALVAWNGRREAARAAFDALPLLRRAREVKVVWVNPQKESDVAGDVPTADICTALARHGVKCEATEAVRPHASVGQTLLLQAKGQGADLLVMGCYGHSRFREFVLGGASEHVLRQMTVPALMSH
jgi:nucleotide-binding universal stress UspA family protein